MRTQARRIVKWITIAAAVGMFVVLLMGGGMLIANKGVQEELKITDEQLNAQLADIAQTNGIALAQLPTKLAQQGVDHQAERRTAGLHDHDAAGLG